MAVAGMVLGIVALTLIIIPAPVTGVIGALVTMACVATGLPLSSVAFYQAKKQRTGLRLPVVGLATNGVVLLLIIAFITLPIEAMLEG